MKSYLFELNVDDLKNSEKIFFVVNKRMASLHQISQRSQKTFN